MKRSAVYRSPAIFASVLVILLIFSSCNKDEGSTEPSVYGSLSGNVSEFYTEVNLGMVNIYTEPATGFVTTAADGDYLIENIMPGEYKVFAAKKNYDTLGVDVTINAGTITYANFILELYDTTDQNYGIITGIVRDSDTELPLSKVMLYTVPATSIVSTNSDGTYSLKNVNSGKYNLFYGKPGYDTLSAEVTVIAGRTTTANLSLEKQDTSTVNIYGLISGKITNSITGQPLSGAVVTTVPALGSYTTDSNGDYSIEKVEPGSYELKVSKTGYTDKSVDIEVTAGNTTIANINITVATGSISGTVIDSDTGNPIAGVNITTSPGTSSINTNAEGGFTINNVTPGTYKLTASKNGFETVTIDLTITAGNDTSSDIVLTASAG